MIPWPIALLAAGYTILATSAAAAMWRYPSLAALGTSQEQGAWSLLWAGGWCAVSVILVAGLATLKPWARVLSIWVSIGLMVSALGAGVLAIAQVPPQPMRSLAATVMACAQVVVLRYLTRPHVRAWFVNNGEGCRVKGEG